MQSFTRNYDDKSLEQGFQFEFKCDICGDGFLSTFVGSKAAKKKSLFNAVSRFGGVVSNNAYLAGALGGQAYKTPEWEREREQAFQQASNEAMPHFHRCPRCHLYACDLDWNEESGLCTSDAPKVASEVAAAKSKVDVSKIQISSEKMIEEARAQPGIPTPLDVQQTICPACGKTSGSGKFCNNCGAPLGMKKCAKCGADNTPSVNFCGNCGNKL